MRAFLGALALALPMVAGAAELRMSMVGGIEYDDNIFRVEDRPTDDVGFQVSPRVHLVDGGRRHSYQLSYRGIYERFLRQRTADDVDHYGNLRATYLLGRRTTLTAGDDVRSIRSRGFDEIEIEDVETGTVTTRLDDDVSRDRTLYNSAYASLDHQFTRHLSGGLNVNHSLFDPEDQRQVGSTGLGAGANLGYQVNADHNLGLSGGVSVQFFDRVEVFDPLRMADRQVQASSTTFVYQLGGTWRWALTADTTLSASAGPAFFRTTQDEFLGSTIPGREIIPSRSATRFTFFTNTRLLHRWSPLLRSSLSYRRSLADASGLGGSTIRDSVVAATTWAPSELWNVGLRAAWVQRNSATRIDRTTGQARDLDTTRWDLSLNGARYFTRKFSVTLHLAYENQKNNQVARSFDNVRAVLGLRYDLDPIRVWN